MFIQVSSNLNQEVIVWNDDKLDRLRQKNLNPWINPSGAFWVGSSTLLANVRLEHQCLTTKNTLALMLLSCYNEKSFMTD
jgi:hypothetical protein